jgi:hypothetical protein
MGEKKAPRQAFDGFINAVVGMIDSPVSWFRGKTIAISMGMGIITANTTCIFCRKGCDTKQGELPLVS